MELTNRREVRRLLKQYGITPRKHWGQNFLVSQKVLRRILNAAKVQKGETILEIGGGVGTLSVALAERAKNVVVVERDPKLCAALHDALKSHQNATIHCTDARKLTTDVLPKEPYRLIANLPYSVALPILRNLLEGPKPPQDCLVMLQREVAERLTAKPPKMTLAGVTMQYLAKTELLFTVARESMWPVPDVTSAVVRLHPRPRQSAGERERFMTTVKRGFAHPRKYVLRNLSEDATTREKLHRRCSVPKKARPHGLSLTQWQCVSRETDES